MARRSGTALIVDDDVMIRAVLAELLDELDFDVQTASNGFSAVRLAAEQRPDLVLLDLALPEVSGADVLRELRASAATRDAAVVVVTGNPQTLSEAELEHVDGIALKPFDVPGLLLTVERALQEAAARQAGTGHVTDAAAAKDARHEHVRPVRHRPPPHRSTHHR